MSRASKAFVCLILVTVAWTAAPEAHACTVCFGESNDPIVKGLEASAFFLIGVTYFLLIGGVVTFLLLRRRARRLAAASNLAEATAVASAATSLTDPN